jgi:hypothetical protein
MTERLTPEDYRLLDEMNQRGGAARISDGRPRHGAERLIPAGFATSRPLNTSDVEYEMTPLGRRAFILKRHGIASVDIGTIEPHRSDVDGLWYVKVSCPGDPAVLMGIGAASKLAASLRFAHVDDLAEDFEKEVDRARRFAQSGL